MNQKHVDARLNLFARKPLRKEHKTNQKRGVRIPIDKVERELISLNRIQFFSKRLAQNIICASCTHIAQE